MVIHFINEDQTEIYLQDNIFIMADRYEKEQKLMAEMMMELMEEKKAKVGWIEDIEFEEITNNDKTYSDSKV